MQWMTEETGWMLPETEGYCPADSPPQFLQLGAGMAQAAAVCGVGHAAGDYPAAVAAMICGGIAAAGGNACLIRDCIPAELAAVGDITDCGMLLYCGNTHLQAYSAGLLPLTQKQVHALSAGGQHPWQSRNEYGSIRTETGKKLRYEAQIRQKIPHHLTNHIIVHCADTRLHSLAAAWFDGGSGQPLTLQLSADGRRASIYSESDGWFFYEKLLLMLCQACLAAGQDVALPFWVSGIAEEMAHAAGQSILRYSAHSNGNDYEARHLARQQGFTLDGMLLCAAFLRVLQETHLQPSAWAASLPPWGTVRRVLQTDAEMDAIARCGSLLHLSKTPDGFRGQTERGRVLLYPSRMGKQVTLMVEAAGMEAAHELAGDIAAQLHPHD